MADPLRTGPRPDWASAPTVLTGPSDQSRKEGRWSYMPAKKKAAKKTAKKGKKK
jgi:hypothetical protein